MSLGSHQRTVGKSQTHITPLSLIEALGPFDTDPCAADPRPWDCAKRNYSTDGLILPWVGRVWLNPPFNRYDVGEWVRKLAEHGDGIALLHARTETAWFRPIWESAGGILFLSKRIIFHKQDGTKQTTTGGKIANSGAPVVLCAFGENNVRKLRESGLRGALVGSVEMLEAA